MAEEGGNKLIETAETHHQKIRRQAKSSAADAIIAGRALIAAKAKAPGKGWLASLKGATSMNPRSVQRYMLLARAKDAGILPENVEEMSFSQAYRLALKQVARIARKATPASTGKAAESGDLNKALRAFRRAAREAVAAGVPFKRLERELSERIGAHVLGGAPAEEAEENEDQPE